MKLLVVTGIFPPDIGGPATYVPVIASALADYNVEVPAVVTLSSTPSNDSSYPFRVLRINRHKNKIIRVIKTIAVIFKESQNCDAIYLNGLVFEGMIAGKIFRKKTVVMKVVGDLAWEKANRDTLKHPDLEQFHKSPTSMKFWLLKKIQTCYSKLADHVITPSNYLREIVALWGVDKSKISVIYNATNEAPTFQTKQEIEFDVVTVARLVPWKRIDDLIRICASKELSLIVVGDGPQFQELKELANELNCKVQFSGKVKQSEVPALISKAKIFVLNSTYEGLPHIVLEAYSLGVTVIASDAGGTNEVMKAVSPGNMYPVNDMQKLTEIMLTKIKDFEDNPRLREQHLNLEPFTIKPWFRKQLKCLLT